MHFMRDMLQGYAEKDPLRMHMPGHKGRGVLPGALWDVTELGPTDNLAAPQHAILAAQRSAAQAWNAGMSRFLVNGATQGIQAMLLWCKANGLRVVLPRDCHISAIHACMAFGIEPVWVWPKYSNERMLGDCPAIQGYTAGDAIFVVYPDYYGRCMDIAELKRNNPGALVLADAAHGAHLAFYPDGPKDAGQGGADAWVVGAHKTLPAYTQSAILHVNHGPMAEGIDSMLEMVGTTSPSYLLMMGLDSAREYMQRNREAIEAHRAQCTAFGESDPGQGLHICTQEWARDAGFAGKDPLRLVVDVSERGLTGWGAQKALETAGVYVEMADMKRLVTITSPMDTAEDYARLGAALRDLPRGETQFCTDEEARYSPPQVRMPMAQAMTAQTQQVPIRQAVGRVLAGPAGAYPPGVALCVGGEVLSEQAARTLERAWQCFGVKDGTVRVIK